jgi:TonB family protein
MTSRDFVLFTDTTEVKGRRLLEDFEGRLAAMKAALGEIPDRQFPIEVFLFSNKEEFLEVAPRPTGPDAPRESEKAAHLWRGPDRVFVVARDKAPGDIAEDVGHSLGHVFFERLVLWRPFWLAEGAAEYFRKVGRNPDNRRIAEKDGYPVADILDIVPIREYDDDAGLTAFKIQSHRLLRVVLGQDGAAFRAFLKALGPGTEEEAKLDVDVGILQPRLNTYSETLIPPGSGAWDIKVSAMSPGEIAIHRGDLLVAARKTSEAATWYKGDSASARAGRAILTRFSRGVGESIGVLARASSDFPDAGLVHFHLGSIETKTASDIDLQARALERAVELLPRLGRARGQLARVQTIMGKSEEALTQIDRALALEPEFGDEFFMIKAEALLGLQQFGEARKAAQIAASLPHLDKTVDYDFKGSELSRRADETRRDIEGKQLARIRAEVEALVARREPPPAPPPPPPTAVLDRSGRIEYNVQSSRQISIVDAPLPVYSNSLIQRGAAGNVTVRAAIGTDGKVTQVSIVESQLPEVNVATLAAVRKWTFKLPTGTASADARIVFRFIVQ